MTKLNFTIQNKASLSGPSGKIPMYPDNFHRLYNSKLVPTEWVDGDINTHPGTEYSVVFSAQERRTIYEFKGFDNVVLDKIRLYDSIKGTFGDSPMDVYAVDKFFQRKYLGSFYGTKSNDWEELNFSPVSVKWLLLTGSNVGVGDRSNEFEVYGTYTDLNIPSPNLFKPILADHLFGVNTYEWNLFQGGGTIPARTIDPNKRAMYNHVKTIRHYLDWARIEGTEGSFRYQPEQGGSWYLDDFYEEFNDSGIETLLCVQGIPDWIMNTWPPGEQNHENRPHKGGLDPSDPNSYIEQAKFGFQLAARYGSNDNIDPNLVLVNTEPRWEGDVPNVKKIGLGTIRYIECANENNRGWKGRKAYQTGREHAANLSAFYDGHMGTMGPNVGVKTADPNMIVTTCGTVGIDTSWFKHLILWSIEHRGYKEDGTPNVPFDCVNFHSYRNDGGSEQYQGTRTRGMAPEPSGYYEEVIRLREMLYEYFGNSMPIINGETGYDLHQSSIQKAIPIGSKPATTTQADWLLRMALESGRSGVEKLYIYQMYDDAPGSSTQYMTSGVANHVSPQTTRPPLNYNTQVLSVISGFTLSEDISSEPRVVKWSKENEDVYMIWSGTEEGITGNYTLVIPDSQSSATMYNLNTDTTTPTSTTLTVAGSYNIPYSETPVMVKVVRT